MVRVIHQVGERHEAVGRAREVERATGPPDLQVIPAALLAALPVTDPASYIGVAAAEAGAVAEGGVGPPLVRHVGARPRVAPVRLVARVAGGAAVRVERLGVKVVWPRVATADTGRLDGEVDVAGMAVIGATSVGACGGKGPP